MEVVKLREGRPSVSDIPGMLRQMADEIESGQREAKSALFIVPCDGDWPDIFGWGEHLGDLGNIAVLEIAKAWFIANNTARAAG